MNKVEQWKSEKHGLDVWPNVLEYAEKRTPMKSIDDAELERMKWYGVFYRKRDGEGTYMLRIRLTANELTSAQAKEIAYIAYEYGYGIVDVTTRANVQVQGLSIDHVPRALARLEAVGITAKQTGHDNIRNVFGHPLAGVDPDELIDTRPLCREITNLFLGSRIYSDLPRKVNIAMSGAAQHASHYWSQDISFLAAETDEGETAFQVLLAGTQGQNPHLPWHLPVLVRPEQVTPVAKAILDLFREQGSRERRDAARLRYLVERIGVGGVLAELERRLDFPLEACVHQPQPPSGYDDLVGWFRQKEAARWAMGLCVPLGRLSWQQLEGLGVLAKRWGSGNLRATPEQGMMVLDIPSGFKDAAATSAAALGLSPHADSLARNTVACTGKQFCNIAVTETKGHMFQLIEALRKRAVTLHGIRIHMSGCPSSCAQHHTADIGLKGVRVRRMIGTCEGFDIYLGGGIAGQMHLAFPYKMGVDVHQLPLVIEDVIRQFYLRHRPGQTFSAYWREELKNQEAAKVGDGEYTPPTWLCENCNHRHLGEDPPVFCPSCAGLRRHFARLESDRDEPAAEQAPAPPQLAAEMPRSDGFAFACRTDQVVEGQGIAAEVGGKEIALFRVGGKIVAIDNACPHEGAPLAQGTIEAGVVTCPWHGWAFNACTGCSLDPPGKKVSPYEVKLEAEKVHVNIGGKTTPSPPAAAKMPQPVTASLRVLSVRDESLHVKTFVLDNTAGAIPPHKPGQFVKVCVTPDGKECWRSFTICSSPTRRDVLELTIKRNPAGEVSNYLFDRLGAGDVLTIKGPQGGFYYDEARHAEPLLLVSAGSGITPMMSIVRYLAVTMPQKPVAFVYGARSEADILFFDEMQGLLTQMPSLQYAVSLSRPSDGWSGPCGRLSGELVREVAPDLASRRAFLCGPADFMEQLSAALVAGGLPEERIHTEQFHTTAVKLAQV